ncbi:hypothetical protein PDJAM_G00209990 [Pangasius djambal]|uniref:Uncharacterized protein n=1 Tax=Pangasius djambal TaxID=1691987 RepID=A0ACC5Y9K1_9TELE|nr:hypothetical protein [Pangasius djambal]
MKDPSDIRIPVDVYESTKETNKRQAGHGMSMPESEYSLRAYCSILYLKPRMQIILRGLKVEALFVTKTLAKKEGITITFGYNTKSKGHYGLMMYHKNRLIKAYERVACQRKANSTGVGVIGVIECNYLTPTHNKQDFENTDEYRSCTVEEEPEDSDDEQPGYQKTYKQHERNQKLQEEKNRQQMEEEQRTAALNEQDTALLRKEQDLMRQLRSSSPSTHRSSIQRAPSSTVNSSSLTGSSPSVNNSIITHFTAFPSTPTGKKRALSPSQENPEKKSARMRPLLDIQDIPSTSTALFEALCLPAMFIPYSEGNKGVGTDIKTEPKDSGDDVIDKSTVKKEQCNEFTQTSSEDLQNYKVLYLQVKEEIKQIQQKLREQEKEQEKLKGKVDSLKDEKYTLLTCWESLQKEVGVEELEWPAQSPGLNPNEHLWDELVHRLHLRPPHPTSVPDFTYALVAE